MLLPRFTRDLEEQVRLKTDVEHFVFATLAATDAFISLNKDILESKSHGIKQIASLFGIRKIPKIYDARELADKIKQLKR